MISPGGRPIDESPLGHGGKNWVTKEGGLPGYMRGIARAIARKHGGDVTSADIAKAYGALERFVASPHTTPKVKAAAAAALAEFKAKATASHALSADGVGDIELAATAGHHIAGTSYHWYHNWHARDRSTALLYRKTGDLKHLEKSGAKFHNVEPEEFNTATSKTPKFIGGNDQLPVMKYHKNKVLAGTKHKTVSGHVITVAGVSESKTHVIDTKGQKHKIASLKGHTEADAAALQTFHKKKYKSAIKTYSIKSSFAPSPKPYVLPKHSKNPEPLNVPQKIAKNHYTADPHHFGEPEFPGSKSLPQPNVSGSLTASELKALKSYTGSGYATINNQLRHHQAEGEPIHPTVKALDSALGKATPLKEPNLILHRGFSVQALAGLQPGDSFVDKGFVSTSRNHRVGQNFGGGTTRIHIESSHPDLKALDVYGISQHPSEAEVLLGRNTKFTVKRRVNHGGHAHLYVHAEPAVTVAAKVGKKAAA